MRNAQPLTWSHFVENIKNDKYVRIHIKHKFKNSHRERKKLYTKLTISVMQGLNGGGGIFLFISFWALNFIIIAY